MVILITTNILNYGEGLKQITVLRKSARSAGENCSYENVPQISQIFAEEVWKQLVEKSSAFKRKNFC